MKDKDELKMNEIIQALCNRKLQSESQDIFVSASLPNADIDALQRKIVDVIEDFKSFSKDLAEIKGKFEKEG